ncbi:hypothetical protein V6N12_018873 [Hibiscus sabdariffa]|uniref:Protein kinase domain-containing protein n=1 Tax=Hibiscus sabdariffa TaxID=183260 RepID=A0ABR2AU35_9ROSI
MAWVWAPLLLLSSLCVQQSSCIIPLGASLSSATQKTSWASPSGHFAFGFYNRGSGFSVGVWLNGNGKNANKVIWTANRDDPPFTSTATLILNEKGVILSSSTAENGEKKFIANPSNSDASKQLGCLLRLHARFREFCGQSLVPNQELISSLSESDPSTGRFHLSMQNDGNLVLYPLESENSPITAYWSTKTFGLNLSLRLFLNSTGLLQLINNFDSSVYDTINGLFHQEASYSDYDDSRSSSSSSSKNIVYSASLDVDGNFRLYTHVFESNGGFQTYALLRALVNSCKIKGFCGFNSYCTFNDIRPYCACLPGTDFMDPNQNTLGCKRNYSEAHCKGGKANIPFYNITPMHGIEWTAGRFYSKERLSKDACGQTCLEDCNCEAAQFENGVCRKQKLPLRFLLRDTEAQVNSTVLLKVGIISLEAHNDTASPGLKPPKILIKQENSAVQILVLSFILVACSCALITTSGVFIYKFRVLRYKRLLEMGNLGLTGDLMLTFFSYKELKRATNGFKEKLGKGSFGAVYKGTLDRGRKPIAVKRLEKLVEEGEKEFQTETRAIVVRGTRGYMAPEWHKNIPISVKADIYSFGIVLLEAVFCRRNLDTNVSKPEEIILSSLVYRCLVERELDKLVVDEEVDKGSLERMVMVALWCIQDQPALRPSIKSVVMMLEGITDIFIPPCPTDSYM